MQPPAGAGRPQLTRHPHRKEASEQPAQRRASSRRRGTAPDEAAAELLIGHGTFLLRDNFTHHLCIAPSIGDGRLLALIDWDAVTAALDAGRLPASGERCVLRIAASLAADYPVSLRDAIPGLDQRNLDLVTAAVRQHAGRRR